MELYDVYFYEAFAEEEQELKHFIRRDFKAGFTWKTIQEAGDKIPPSKIISIRTQSDIPFNWSGKLDAIVSRSTGFNHILEYWQNCGKEIPSGYLPLYCHRSVAEQAMLLWMSLLRKLSVQVRQFQSFNRDGLTGLETKGRTLLVVGVGNIGYEVFKIGKGLEMNVLGVDIVERYKDVHYVSIEKGMKEAGIIVCAMNLTEINKGYFNKNLFYNVKKNVIFINVSRGELSPASDLLELINNKTIAGVALDVYNYENVLAVALRENVKVDNPEVNAVLELAKKDNVILTPHNAFNTSEAVMRKSEQTVQQINSFLDKGEFIWPVINE